MLSLGDVFVNRNPGSPHLPWVIASTPTGIGVVAFLIEPVPRRSCDTTCVIEVDELPCIPRRSFVNYELGRLITQAQQQALRDGDYCEFQAPIALGLLRRILEGAVRSDFTPQGMQSLVEQALKELEP